MKNKNIYIMKQPELGQKILELRKSKGFTQEELVEQCNINVRTIQRIEAGEVSPRSYTIKAILEVLGFNYEDVFDKNYLPEKIDNILGINKEKINKQLKQAFIFGVIYLIAIVFEIFVSFLAFKDSFIFNILHIISKSLSFISLLLFFRGFVIIGGIYKNQLLKNCAFLFIGLSLLLSVLEVAFFYIKDNTFGIFISSKLITFGVLSILMGVAIMRLKVFNRLVKFIGILEIVVGIFFLLTFLSPIGFLINLAVIILQIILVHKIMTEFEVI